MNNTWKVKENTMTLIQRDCILALREIDTESVDLTITSPPYDNLRTYNGNSNWCTQSWQEIIKSLYRVTKQGGVVVWVVGDATINGSETGTSFQQALFAKQVGFNLHDTMIYQKNALPKNHNRYEQDFEYMFVFSKGKPKTFNPIRIPTLYPEKETARQNSYYSVTNEINRSARSGKKRNPVGKEKIKGNIWKYAVCKGHSTKDEIAFKHPAIFPEKLVEDHVLSWSNVGDTVLDPMMGSGTTGKVALALNRNFIGIEEDSVYFNIAKERIGN